MKCLILSNNRRRKALFLAYAVSIVSFVYFFIYSNTRYQWIFLDKDKEDQWDEAFYSSKASFCDVKNTSYCHSMFPEKTVNLLKNEPKKPIVDFRQVILVISFNTPTYESILKVHHLYRRLFKKIVYCVTDKAALLSFHSGRFAPVFNHSFVTFVNQPLHQKLNGATFYSCIPAVVDSLPQVVDMLHDKEASGILHISDDLILGIWNFEADLFDLSSNWVMTPKQGLYDAANLLECETTNFTCDSQSAWYPLLLYKDTIVKALNESAQVFPEFIKRLVASTGGENRVWNVYSDLFYISRDFVFEAAEILRIFNKHSAYMELTVGTVIMTLTPSTRLIGVNRGGQLEDAVRNFTVGESYDAAYHVYHPFKMAALEGETPERQCLYCLLVQKFDQLRSHNMAL